VSARPFGATLSGPPTAGCLEHWQITAAATGSVEINEFRLGPNSAGTAVEHTHVQRKSAGGSSTSRTPEKMSSRQPAKTATYGDSMSLAGTPVGSPILMMSSGRPNDIHHGWAAPRPNARPVVAASEIIGGAQTGTSHSVIWSIMCAENGDQYGSPSARNNGGRRPIRRGNWGYRNSYQTKTWWSAAPAGVFKMIHNHVRELTMHQDLWRYRRSWSTLFAGVPFPTTAVLDDFNRANTGPPPSANWSTDIAALSDGGYKVVSNQLIESATGPTQWSQWWNATAFGNDQECYFTYGSGGVSQVELWIRMNNVGTGGLTGYAVHVDATTFYLYRWNAGSSTTLTSAITHGLAAGSKLGLRMVGSLLQLFTDNGSGWQLRDQVVDATYATGSRIGLLTQNSARTFDDYGGGTYVPPGSGTVFFQALTAAGVGTASMVRSVGKQIAAAGTGSPTITRLIAKILSAGGSGSPQIVRRTSKALTASGTGTASLSASRLFLMTLTAAGTGTASMVRQVGKLVTGSGTGTPSVVKRVSKNVTASGTGTPSVIKRVGKALTAAGTGTASMIRRTSKNVIASGTGAPTVTKRVSKTVAASGTGTPSFVRQISKRLTAAGSGTASIATFVVTALPPIVTQFFSSALARVGLTTSQADVPDIEQPRPGPSVGNAPGVGDFDTPTPGGDT
jgi:hypothetical protein